MRVAIYARVSTEDKGQDPENQLRDLRAWCASSGLTASQKKFVDAPTDKPIRLRGAAGTGKTVAMVVKCLRELYRMENEGKQAKIAFITHSEALSTEVEALSTEVIEGMLFAMDTTRRWERTKNSSLWTGSLYQLARDYQDYQSKGLRPLSLDGIEGRDYQKLLALDALNKSLKNSWFANDMLAQCTPQFQDLVKNRANRDRFIEQLLNEFASVIDAEGVRWGTESAKGYLNNARDDWLMSLPSEFERRVVLYIHDQYCKDLDNSQYLSLDQMIGDFSRYLMTSAQWRQLRNRAQDKKGFDLIFVDEFHHFNRIEAGIFHNLFSRDYQSLLKVEEGTDENPDIYENGSDASRPDEDPKRLPPLFMAYDLKQGATDAGVRTASLFRAAAGGGTTLVELTEVFRSTPAIANFLADLDGAFPAYQMAGEWPRYPAQRPVEASNVTGIPTLQVFGKNTELLDAIFGAAEREAIEIGGRQVAILCPNDKLFDTYLQTGREKARDKYVAVKSRSDIGELRYVRRKVVFSMPQHIQGLQFESVYLINVDQGDLPPGASESERRRCITRCYIGASRAVARLVIASSEERGGPCHLKHMRRVIVDQIEALAELNRIVARHSRSLDVVEPAALRIEAAEVG